MRTQFYTCTRCKKEFDKKELWQYDGEEFLGWDRDDIKCHGYCLKELFEFHESGTSELVEMPNHLHHLIPSLVESQDNPYQIFAEYGRQGGKKSKRTLSPEQAREMLKAREKKRKSKSKK